MSKEAEKFIEKYTTKDQKDWLVEKKDIIVKFMESYHTEKLRTANVSKCYTENDIENAYDKGFSDGNQRNLTGSLIEVL